MRIQKLVLDKFACFDHIEMEFPEGHRADRADIHLLVGPNGTGKTSVLTALTALNRFGSGLFRRANDDTVIEIWTAVAEHQRRQRWNPRGRHPEPWQTAPLLFGATEDPAAYPGSSPRGGFTNSESHRRQSALLCYSGTRGAITAEIPGIAAIEGDPTHTSVDLESAATPNEFAQWVANTDYRAPRDRRGISTPEK
jgi:hypothetical protein